MEEIKWPEITKDTPMPELKRIHQMIWDYAIEHGYKPVTPYCCYCVACEYDIRHNGYDDKCPGCPIAWPKTSNGTRVCSTEGGLYYRWHHAEGEERTALAKQIRDLPWKFEIEES